MALPLLPPAAGTVTAASAPAAAAPAAAAGGGLRSALRLNNLIEGANLGNSILNNILGANTSNVNQSSKYLPSDTTELRLLAQQDRRNLLIGILDKIGLGDVLQPIDANERLNNISDRRSRMLEESTNRQIQLETAKGILAQELRQIIEGGATQRQRISSTADVMARQDEGSKKLAGQQLEATIGKLLSAKDVPRAVQLDSLQGIVSRG